METVAASVEAFTTHLRDGRQASAHTVQGYVSEMTGFLAWLKVEADDVLTIDQVETGTLRRYVAARAATGLEPASIARLVSCLRTWGRFLAQTERLPASPATALHAPKVRRALPHVLDPEQVDQLLAAPQGDDEVACRDRAIFEVLYSTGARVGELVGLDDRDVDTIAGVAKLRGKGRKERLAMFGKPAVRAFEAYRAVRDRVHGRPTDVKRGVFLSANAMAANVWPTATCGASWRGISPPAACPRAPRRTPCATVSRPICCRTAPTSARSRNCSAMRA